MEDGTKRKREQRDPIVKLVVACCFLDFISQPFLTMWIAVFCGAAVLCSRIDDLRAIGAKLRYMKASREYISSTGRKARMHCSQSGCDMLMRAFISQPALMSVAPRCAPRITFIYALKRIHSSIGELELAGLVQNHENVLV